VIVPGAAAPVLVPAMAAYCRSHWNTETTFDDGFYDATYGTCPRGHRRMAAGSAGGLVTGVVAAARSRCSPSWRKRC